jgi:hypothetical protein
VTPKGVSEDGPTAEWGADVHNVAISDGSRASVSRIRPPQNDPPQRARAREHSPQPSILGGVDGCQDEAHTLT